MARCGKRCFPGKQAATRALRRVPLTAGKPPPVRVYRCGRCGAWHYTANVRGPRKALRSG